MRQRTNSLDAVIGAGYIMSQSAISLINQQNVTISDYNPVKSVKIDNNSEKMSLKEFVDLFKSSVLSENIDNTISFFTKYPVTIEQLNSYLGYEFSREDIDRSTPVGQYYVRCINKITYKQLKDLYNKCVIPNVKEMKELKDLLLVEAAKLWF